MAATCISAQSSARVPLAPALAVAALLGATASEDALARDNYGAIAYSLPDGIWGYSYDYASKAAADSRALSECRDAGGRACAIRMRVGNACGAVAVGDGNGWGAYGGDTRAEAELAALNTCRQYTTNCVVKVWVCTTR